MKIALWTLLLLLLFPSCLKIEVLGEALKGNVDTLVVKTRHEQTPPQQPTRDTTEERIPIVFIPTIEDWEEKESEL